MHRFYFFDILVGQKWYLRFYSFSPSGWRIDLKPYPRKCVLQHRDHKQHNKIFHSTPFGGNSHMYVVIRMSTAINNCNNIFIELWKLDVLAVYNYDQKWNYKI